MIIGDILGKLENSAHPVARALAKSEDLKLTILAFKTGMVLKDHSTPFPSTLFVLSGSIEYSEGDKSLHLNKFDDTAIAAGAVHAVYCLEDAVCLLLQHKIENV